MRLSEIETKRAQKLAELTALIDVRDQSSREFTADEAARFDALEAEVTNLNADFAREQKAESIRKQTALNKANQDAPETKVAKRYSFIDAIQSQLPGRKLDGLTAEMHQEAEKELRAHGVNTGLEGRGIPS